jgi:hypothetical protein
MRSKDSLFKQVIEERAAAEANKSLHYFPKTFANCVSYGLFVELIPNENKQQDAVKVWWGLYALRGKCYTPLPQWNWNPRGPGARARRVRRMRRGKGIVSS